MNVKGKGFLWLSPLAIAVTLAACGGNGSDRGRINLPGVAQGPSLLVMHNGSDNAGQIDRLNAGLKVQGTFNADANEGIALDLLGNLYGANDSAGAPSTLQVLHQLAERTDGSAAVPALDRSIAAPGSMTLKGIAIAHQAGLVMAANTGGNSVQVYGTAAGGSATPLASTALSGNAWDLAYDEAADRLFLAMTNGTVIVVDDYVAGGFMATPARVAPTADRERYRRW